MQYFSKKTLLLLLIVILSAILAQPVKAGLFDDISNFFRKTINIGGFNVCFPSQGCTGTSTLGNVGDVLVWQSSNVYAPRATSTLGLNSSGSFTTTTINGLSATAYTFNASGTAFTISTSSPGTVLISLPQNLNATATPTFASGTFSNFTAGSIPFFGTGGAMSQSNSKLFWNNTTNSLGVGTASPSGTIYAVGNWSNNYGALTLDGDKPTLRLDSTQGAGGNSKWLMHVGTVPAGGLQFYHGTDGSNWGTALWSITEGGNIGIATTTPLTALTVVGSSTISQGLNVNSGTLFVNDANGYVGIGTTTPSYPLHIHSANLQPLDVNTTNSIGPLLTFSAKGVEKGYLGMDGGTYIAGTSQNDIILGTVTPSTINFSANTGNADLSINSSGKVGVGTTAPSSTLHIIGTVSITPVAGSIKANVGGSVFDNVTTVGNSAATETSLASTTIATSTFSNNGDAIIFRMGGTYGSGSSSNKDIKIVLWQGTASTTIFDTTGINTTSQEWGINGMCERTGASTQKCSTLFASSATTLRGFSDYATAALTSANNFVIDLRGNGTNANDVVKEIFRVSFEPSP